MRKPDAPPAPPPSSLPRKDEEPAPLFGTWRRAYAVVLGVLVLLIAGFAALTHIYR